MRLFLALLLLPTQTLAWEFTPRPICTLSHDSEAARMTVVFDPAVPVYRLDVTLKSAPWAASPTFGMAFEGGRAITIGTDRHSVEGQTLSVSDRGFGNVLDGLEFNTRATAFTGSQGVAVSLDGAAAPVRAFRACARQLPALS
ncbi:excinuclease ABC subunit B [Pseudoruegeria sp. SHC-113]|uniref:excinuclease ABC subunit B n=1 Tax=Pseudoruegeria sp. SHC-113 TaxID=2855439 RepID=UPI0021BB1754|nr:excinuclease ABC subunit B [Pseudoruegeria sp. SHC-113]MCT8161417.1 excinuclease ABC subunit B [Pseudoruegeria sp. SHC-113]